MSDIGEALRTNQLRVMQYFYNGLKRHGIPSGASKDEVMYVTSIVASHAQTSREESNGLPLPASLREIYEKFVLDDLDGKCLINMQDPEILTQLAALTLIQNGLFRNRTRGSAATHLYDKMGSEFFLRASEKTPGDKMSEVFHGVAVRFTPWARTNSKMWRDLGDNYYLITTPRLWN